MLMNVVNLYRIPTSTMWNAVEKNFISEFLKKKPEGATQEQLSEIVSVFAFEFSRA